MEPQKKGLGRGIASLIPVRPAEPAAQPAPNTILNATTNAAPESKTYFKVPIAQIVPNPLQPRKFFDDTKLSELSQSIKDKGVLHPLIVTKKDGHYELVSGERRLRASKLAGLVEIPVILREGGPSEVLELAIIENVQREDLDAIEEAAAYQELMDKFGYTQEQVAQKVGKERATVANLLRLLKLPLKAKEALRKAFQTQIDGKGFSFVEILSTCPTNWGMSPLDAAKRVRDVVSKEFPLGEYAERGASHA